MSNEDICCVCGADPIAITRYYADHPFVDGRNYELICWTCACVPKTEYKDENGKWVILRHVDSDFLNTLEEMVTEGFNRARSDRSVKAVRGLLKRIKFHFDPEGDAHIFDKLFFGDTIEMPLTV